MRFFRSDVREADIMLLNYDAGNLRIDIQSKLEKAQKAARAKGFPFKEITKNEEVSATR